MSEPTTGYPGPPGHPRHPHEDLAAYALDALDDAERRAVDDHLAGCPVCRAELAEHHRTLAALTPDEPPPPGVWQRIAADIGAPSLPDPHAVPPGAGDDAVVPFRRDEAGGPSRGPAHAARTRSGQGRRSRWVAAGGALAAAAAVAAAFGIARTSGSDDGADTISEVAQRAEESGETLGTLTDTDGRPVAEVVAADGASFLLLDGLEPLPEGRSYQLWSLDGAEPVSLGLLGDGRTEAVAVPQLDTVSEVAISDEQRSGVTAPQGPIVATGRLTPS